MKKQVTRGRDRKPARPQHAKRASRPALRSRTRPAAAKPSPPPPQKSKTPAAIQAAQIHSRMADAEQQRLYDQAMRLFQGHHFDQADQLFQKVMAGPNRSLALHAQMHSQVCQKRMRPPELHLKTADDHYHYAVTLMNARRLPEAADHLEMALRMMPGADHLHYALAATRALQGNPQGAYERLRTAIDLNPHNRILARGDADFAAILQYPPVATLLQLDRGYAPKSP